jgi:hypothetical protein
MRRGARSLIQSSVIERIQRLTREIEALVPELKGSRGRMGVARALLAGPARSLERAATAVRSLAEAAAWRSHPLPSDVRDLLADTGPLMSLLGSRVVLARTSTGGPSRPSTGAQALAILLEDPARTFAAAEIARRLGCSIPVARTTLNRLVQGGHARRPKAGHFKAVAR